MAGIDFVDEGIEQEMYNSDFEGDEEEMIEPRLKYERLANDVTRHILHDSASCLTIHSKFMALGTSWGKIYLIDLMGITIHIPHQLAMHTMAVNNISIDENGDYLASCSDDGRVIIHDIYSTDYNQIIKIDQPVKSVAISPNFFKPGSGRMFVYGDDKLTLNEKGFFNNKSTVLHEGQGPVRNVSWKGLFIAWANDLGVKMYDMSSRKMITQINRDSTVHGPQVARCNLCWKDDTNLIVGWANSVKICVVKETPSRDAREPPTRYVEIWFSICMDYLICGIAPLDDLLVILSCADAVLQKHEKQPGRPQLRIIKTGDGAGDEVFNDALSVKGFQDYGCLDYKLEWSPEQAMYLIVSPKEIIVAKQRDMDDHVQWRVEHEMFEEAMEMALDHAKELKKYNYQQIGLDYLRHLTEQEEFEHLAAVCPKILRKDVSLWAKYITFFCDAKKMEVFYKVIPTRDPMLEITCYERVLHEFLDTNQELFFELIQNWPNNLYRGTLVSSEILNKLETDRNNRLLLDSLALLYIYDNKYDKALYIYVTLKRDNVFDLIREHKLYEAISDRIITLMDFDMSSTVELLLTYRDKIPIETVLPQLEKFPNYKYAYLSQMFAKDPLIGTEYHSLMLDLFVEHDPSKLLSFFKSSNHYSLPKAVELCTRRNLYEELVYLLARMGNTKQALEVITLQQKDIGKAIDFCKSCGDEDLWNDLIDFSLDKPAYITELLNGIGTHVDPILLIKKIKYGMEIPGLRESLVKIIHDYSFQIGMLVTCEKILTSDCTDLFEERISLQKRGISVDDSERCQCQEPLLNSNFENLSELSVFYCKHIFHSACITSTTLLCPICSSRKKGPVLQ